MITPEELKKCYDLLKIKGFTVESYRYTLTGHKQIGEKTVLVKYSIMGQFIEFCEGVKIGGRYQKIMVESPYWFIADTFEFLEEKIKKLFE